MGDDSRIYYTAALSSSEFWKPIVARLQGCGEDRVAICGQPRTDVMFEPDPGYEIGIDCDRLVMWMPTFRKSAVLGYSDVEEQKTIVPLFSQQELADLNARLRKDRTGLLIKLHPSQDLTGYQGMNLSNIRLMSHEEFGRSGWDLYRLMGMTDALITDYSSVFTDYMLLDRPIAFTLDDYVAQGTMTEVQRQTIMTAIREHKNIIAAGGTASGKTTLLNAILAERGEL